MKYTIISLLALILFTSPSLSATPDRPCNPAISNWVNAAPTTCPIQGSGSNPFERAVRTPDIPEPPPHECPPKGDETPA